MIFRPPRAVGTLLGGAFALWCFALALVLVARGLTSEIVVGTISLYAVAALFIVLAVLFAYWTYSLGTLRYALDRNALTITWGDVRQFVPMSQIDRLVPGRELPNPHIEGVSWLGHHVGRAQVEGGIGDTLFYSTHRSPADLLYVVTYTQSYAISVDDEVAFAEAIQQHQRLGSLVAIPQAPDRLYLAAQPFWEDRTAHTLTLLAIAAFFAMFGYLYSQYSDLPQSVALSFPQLNGITRVGSKDELLKLPIAGAAVLGANLALGFVAHSWERMVGYVLLAATVGMQGVLLAAAIIAMERAG